MSFECLDHLDNYAYLTLRTRNIKKNRRRSRSLIRLNTLDCSEGTDIRSVDLSQVDKFIKNLCIQTCLF